MQLWKKLFFTYIYRNMVGMSDILLVFSFSLQLYTLTFLHDVNTYKISQGQTPSSCGPPISADSNPSPWLLSNTRLPDGVRCGGAATILAGGGVMHPTFFKCECFYCIDPPPSNTLIPRPSNLWCIPCSGGLSLAVTIYSRLTLLPT